MNSLLVLLTYYLVLLLVSVNESVDSEPRHDISLSYVCDSNGLIDLEFSGNDSRNIRYGMGMCGRQSIMVNFTIGFDRGTLSGCEKNMDIHLYIYDHEPAFVNKSLATQTYVLQCITTSRQLTAVPMKRSIEAQSRRAITLTESHTTSALIMELVNGSESINLGDQYTLRISGPQNYTIFPESCNASSDQAFVREVTLMENGCTRDTSLLTGFHMEDGTPPVVEASLHGFHLVYSDTVYIKCIVKVCQSSQCEITPADFNETDCNSYGYITDNNISGTNNSEASQLVGTSFTVKNPALDYFNSSAEEAPTPVLMLWLAVCARYISLQS